MTQLRSVLAEDSASFCNFTKQSIQDRFHFVLSLFDSIDELESVFEHGITSIKDTIGRNDLKLGLLHEVSFLTVRDSILGHLSSFHLLKCSCHCIILHRCDSIVCFQNSVNVLNGFCTGKCDPIFGLDLVF